MAENNFREQIRIQYRDLFEIILRYWRAYGGLREIFCSPFFHLAIICTALGSGYWLSTSWHGTAISVLPNLLGFGLSGYAIWIGWGDERLREMLMDIETGPHATAYVHVSATFAHFGIAQITAFLFAFMCETFDYELSPTSTLANIFKSFSLSPTFLSNFQPVGNGFGFFLFVYAILTALETTFALFRLTTWLQMQRRATRANPTQRPPP
jgi:hypothetical protein